MVSLLKYGHLIFVFVAVLLFIFSFWDQFRDQKLVKVKVKKILLHTHFTIVLLGVLLIWVEQVNPFAEQNLWLIEKLVAFIAYSVMVYVALNKETRRSMQFWAFIGAFGWLAYIVMLASSKHAILLLG